MTIAQTISAQQILANGVTTQFGFANKIFAATDLVVTLIDTSGNQYPFVNFANTALGLTYTVQNVDVDSGCLVVFSAAPTNGWTVDIRSLTPEVQSTSIKNQGEFLPELHEEFFDRITRELQDLLRLTYTYGIHGPDIEATAWPALPGPSSRKGLLLGFDPGTGLPTLLTGSSSLISVPVGVAQGGTGASSAASAVAGLGFNPITQAEQTGGVTTVNTYYAVGNVLRYGADPTGAAASNTAFNLAFAAAMAASPHTPIYIPAGTYRIASPGLTWANQNDIHVYGDGANQSVLIGQTGAGTYTILTVTADIGLGTTGLNLNLENFGIRNGATSGQNGLLVADFGGAMISNLEIQSSANAMTMKGMANYVVNNVSLLTWNSNSAGNTSLALGSDTHGQLNGPGLFNACQFNGQGNVTAGAAIISVGTFSTVFHGCMFIGVGPALQTVCEFQNQDDVTIHGGYSEGSCNTGANTATLFELGRTAACLNFTLIGGHWFSGNGSFELANAIHSVAMGPTTVVGATFANMAAGAISYSIGANTAVTVINCSAPGGLGKMFNSGVSNAPTTQAIPYWVTPAIQAGYGTPTGASVLSNFPGATATLPQTSGQVAALTAAMIKAGLLGA